MIPYMYSDIVRLIRSLMQIVVNNDIIDGLCLAKISERLIWIKCLPEKEGI